MKSIYLFTLVVGVMCLFVAALLFAAFLFPDVAREFGIGNGGIVSMLIIFFIFSILFAISARQMNRE